MTVQRCRAWVIGVVVLAAAAGLSAAPGALAAPACPRANPSYTDACGPTFAVPTWTDAAGWTDPSQYSTIQLADVNGDGRDELLGRSDAGLEIWWFDTSVGQWRPQVDANGVPQILSAFRSPRPGEKPATDWTQPQWYSTIQTAHITGAPGADVVANFADGMRVYSFAPGPGGSINGGSWSLASSQSRVVPAGSGPSRYLSLHAVGGADWSSPALTSQASYWRYRLYQFSARAGRSTFAPTSSAPQYYLDNTSALMPRPFGGIEPANVYRTPDGVGVQGFRTADWLPFAPDPTSGSACVSSSTCSPFTDNPSPSCPAGSSTCFGSSPAYYETMRVANNMLGRGDGNGYVLGRLSDGLHVATLKQVAFDTPGWDYSIPVLKDLADPSGGLPPTAQWSSLRTGDIDGDGKTDVLALDGTGLQAWSYDPAAKAWRKFAPSTPLALNGDLWSQHPEEYATIQVGDVDGDGRDDVVARGPFGIRTWFYDRRGTGGWERYLPTGYGSPATSGQQAALAELTGQVKAAIPSLAGASSIRDLWAGENPPADSDLSTLETKLVQIGGCTGPSVAAPTTYQACTPPASSTGFTAADWTAVINELLTESDDASKVLGFFGALTDLRQELFVEQGAELPAIGDDLALQAAANTPTTFDPQSLFAGILGIAASLAGIEAPELSAALWVGSELASIIPAPSPTATSSALPSTYAGLQDKFATMVSEIDKSLKVQSQLVRQDQGLLELVGQLRRNGTWAIDKIGLGSAANQGFAAWAYSALLPTVYQRYHITNCQNGFDYGNGQCSAPTGLGVVGGGLDFTMIGPPHAIDQFGAEQVPCLAEQDYSGTDDVCTWTLPPADLMNRVWGPVSPECSYVPGQSDTAWTFGCSAGVDVATSIGQNTWGFPSYEGDPDPYNAPGGFTAVAAQARSRAPIVLGHPRRGQQRAVRGHAEVLGAVTVPRRLRLAGATVTLDRLLFEGRGRGEVARPYGGRAPRAVRIRLRRDGPGRFSGAGGDRRRVRVALLRTGPRGRTRLALRFAAAHFRPPHACEALPVALARHSAPLILESRLVLSHGRFRHRVRIEHHVRCARDPRGNVDRLVFVRHRSHPTRPGLAISVHGPRQVRPGATVRYVARIANRRRPATRVTSSLWDVSLRAGTHVTRIRELRRGRARSVSFTRRAPSDGRSRFCAAVAVTAAGARAAGARSCARIATAGAPAFTG